MCVLLLCVGGPHGVRAPHCGVLWRFPTLPHPLGCSTIGAAGLSFQVRNGAGRFPGAVTTTSLYYWPPPGSLLSRVWLCPLLWAGPVWGGGLVVVRIVVAASPLLVPCVRRGAECGGGGLSGAGAPPPAFVSCPLFWGRVGGVVRGVGPLVPVGSRAPRSASTSGLSTRCSGGGLPPPRGGRGNLISERASRLDAFSGYPFRTWPTSHAPGGTTGTPEVRPSRSSRTRDGPPSSFLRAQRIGTELSHDVLNPARVPL